MKKNLMSLLEEDESGEVEKTKNRGVIAALLLKARTDAHLTHLRQKDKTLATHKAMSKFYEAVGDLADTYIETSMGIDDSFILEEVEESCVITNPIQYFKDLYNTIQAERVNISESFIQNQIDEMCQLIAHTLYRLKNITT